MTQILATTSFNWVNFSYLPFALMQKGQKIKAAILFLETLEIASAPYPNSETALAEA